MPINQLNGIHTCLADLPLSVPLESVQQYEDYIARLQQIPRVLLQSTEVLRAGMKDHLMPVRFLLEKIPAQCQGIIDADPFLLPTKKYPSSISPEDQKRLTAEITAAISNEVLPRLQNFRHVSRYRVRAARPNYPRHHLSPGRREALRKRHLRPHHHAHDSRRNPPTRLARDRSHRSRNDRRREKSGLF